MLGKMGLTILLLVIVQGAVALTEARLLHHSSSGQTVVFNLGSKDAIKEGDYAVILKKIQDYETRDMRLIPVARAKIVKVNSDSSIWIIYRKLDKKFLKKSEAFLILSESHLLEGRRPPNIGRIQYVTTQESSKEQIENHLSGNQENLSKLKNGYLQIAKTRSDEGVSENDSVLVDVESWQVKGDQRFRSSLFKSPHKEEWARQLRLATFEKLVTGYLKRVNDPSFNYDNFYQNHFKTFSSEASLSQSNQNNEYNKYLRQQDSKSLEDAKLMRSVLEKGESWSEEYSDEELTKLMTEVSLLQETDRRKFILSRPTRFSVGFDYGTYLSDAQNDDDLNYKRQSRYSMELDVEATPFLRHEKFERFTLNGTVRLNQTAFSFDNYNADLSERSLTAGANWYPFYAPYRLETGLLFLGTYFRFGRASATAPSLNEKASYTLYSLPGLRAGLKYMMKSHFGLRLILSLETLKLERFESSQTTPKLPEETNLLEGKFNIGFNYAF